ncbi:hypothetical protein FHS29_006220 [Saccharothrix tamanrassetensis]|uniref:DUF1360 domain-containing protein n=1 Tax=Saccharothrix tamanrassetensis TaxID=1051531 RepID=A0A841CQM7_9PSEU|nr:DUF1360 domain-containing protein [Saccharothrix tamanrassetensis]MBB5959599.1 hypothetical protein [Saccharothrix tamanrassetensis]
MSMADSFRRIRSAYAGGEKRPLAGYLASLTSYAALIGVATAVGRRRGVRLPERFPAGDVVLLSVATHKASRLLTKSSVTSVLRAPFTRYDSAAGEAEVNETVRAEGGRHAVGELVTCPFCSGVWVAGALTAGRVLAPRATGLVMTALTAVAASDWLHLGYDRVKRSAAGS